MKKMISRFIVDSLAVFAFTLSAAAQQAYFSTDFEEGMPESFTLHDVDGRTPSIDMQRLGFEVGTAWIVTALAEEAGNHVAVSTSWYKNAGQANDWMVTGPIAIGSEEARLVWRSRASDKDYRDGLKVYVSETGSQVEDFDTGAPVFSVAKEEATWQQHSVDLSAYAGKTIYIAFVNDSKDKACLYVDDIFVGIPSRVGFTLDLPRCYDGYGEIAVSGEAFATGTEPVSGYTITFSLGGETISDSFAGTLTPGTPQAFTLSRPVRLERNATADWEAAIESGDDKTALSGRLSAYLWKVVAEEVTGTWCQYCVRGIGAMNYMREHDPEGFIGIAVHNDGSDRVPDSMAIDGEKYLKYLMQNYNMQGFPHCVVNRNAQYSIDPGNIPTVVKRIKENQQNYIGLSLEGSYDAASGTISAETTVYFAKDYEKAGFKMAYIVVENDVHRTHAETGILNNYCGYDQVNAYAGGSQGECYGFENLPAIINADDIWYQDVARGYPDAEGYQGEGDVFPQDIHEGDSYSHQIEFPMPKTILKSENTELVALLLSRSGAILNAEKCALAPVDTGIREADSGNSQFTINNSHSSLLSPLSSLLYTLQGQPVSHPQPHHIYIQNGKKILWK